MITEYAEYTATNGTSPYTYTWTADSSCVTFDDGEGTSTDGVIGTDITFSNEDCLANSTITLTVTDAKGCTNSTTVVIPNVCDNLVLNPISQEGDYKFKATASSTGCTSIAFSWNYDDNLLDKVSTSTQPFSSAIKLEPASDVSSYPTSTVITVTATDCNDCVETKSFTLNFCVPQVEDLDVDLLCDREGTIYQSGTITIPTPTNCSSTMDWNSAVFDLPSGVSFTNTSNQFIFSGQSEDVTSGVYLVDYSIPTTDGIFSTTGTITMSIISCGEGRTIDIPDRTIPIDCTIYSGGETIEINIENDVVTNTSSTIDWSTWQLVDPPTPNSPSIVLTTNVGGDHVIEYEITNPIIPDVFAWTVCSDSGECSRTTTYTVLDCPTVPTAVADTDCTTCGNSVVVDVLANDTPGGTPLDILTVTPTTPPSGTAVANTDGTITYTAPTNVSGTIQFNYTVDNTSGVTSNSTTVDVDVACAGDNTVENVCLPGGAVQTPYDDLTGEVKTGGTWAFISGPAPQPTPPAVYNDPIDFTGFADGTYVYEYTSTCLTCSDTSTMTYIVGSQTTPPNDECATASSIAYGSSVPGSAFEIGRNDEQCPGLSLPTLSAESVPFNWTLTPAHDIWYTVVMPDPAVVGDYDMTITVDGAAYGTLGIDRPMLALYGGSTCGGKKFVSAATAANQTVSRTVVMVTGSDLTWYFRVGAASGNEGQFDIDVITN